MNEDDPISSSVAKLPVFIPFSKLLFGTCYVLATDELQGTNLV